MKPQRSFWPHGIILTFVLFISGTAALIVIACTHRTDLITANYYEDEIKFQTRLDQLNRTAQLSAVINVTYEAATQSINIALPAGPAAGLTSGRIQLYRPSATGLDRVVQLELDDKGFQTLDATSLLPGLWKVRVEWSAGNQDYYADQSIVIKRGA